MVGMVELRRSACRASSPAASSSASRSPAHSRSGRSVLLLDEPLSALDAQIRRNMLEEIARLHRELPDLTVLYVTHDQTEALTLADRIAIMRDGRLVALGAAQELYRNPPNRFAADFLGRANLLPVEVARHRKRRRLARVRFGDTRAARPATHPALGAGQRCLLCVRPHDLILGDAGAADNALAATVRSGAVAGRPAQHRAGGRGVTLRVASAPLDEARRCPARADGIHFPADSACLIADDDG